MATTADITPKINNIKEQTDKIAETSQQNMKNFKKLLFLNLKQGLDSAKTSNQYLFEIVKKHFKGKLHEEIYKVDVVKKYEKGIICAIKGENNYYNKFFISNEEIMELKNDTLEKIKHPKNTIRKYVPELSREANEYFRKKIQHPQKISKEDFLDEIQYGDSVIIKNENGRMKKLQIDDILDEISTYLKENGETKKSAKKIQTVLNFLNESNNSLASEYIKDFMRLVREKQKKWNKGKTGQELKETFAKDKKRFAEVLKRFINKEKIYVHKENDIDKSAVEFLLKLFGIDKNKVFHEVEHDEAKNIEEGILLDVDETVTGLKVEKKTTIKDGKQITKTKKIASEHSDKSDEAILTNRPSSTTQIIFKIFSELGAIDEKQLPQIQRFVNFVNTADSMDYQVSAVDYPHNYQTIFGLHRIVPIHEIFEYFRNPEHTGFERLTDKYMEHIVTWKNAKTGKEITLKDVSQNHKKRIDENIKNFAELKKQGNRELNYQGINFIVDIDDKLKDGPQTAGYHGYGFFKIYPQRGNIYIYSPKKLPAMIEGYPTDGHFLIINDPIFDDIKKLFERFSTDKIKKTSLKEDMIAYLKKIQKKSNKKNITNVEFNERISKLPKLEKVDIKEKDKRVGIINNIYKKIAFVNLDRERKFNAIFKVEDANILNQFQKGEKVNINISSIEEKEGKLLIKAGSMKKI